MGRALMGGLFGEYRCRGIRMLIRSLGMGRRKRNGGVAINYALTRGAFGCGYQAIFMYHRLPCRDKEF